MLQHLGPTQEAPPPRPGAHRPVAVGVLAGVLVLAAASPLRAQAPHAPRKMGQMRLSLLGVSASVDPLRPVVPKNVASAVRIVVRAGESELSAADVARFLGAGFQVRGEISGPGLRQTVTLPNLQPGEALPADPFLLPLPALTIAGDYELTNLRIVKDGQPVLDVSPSRVTVQVIDQILVTSVQTRPLTLDEIKEKGIVLDNDSYLAFEFTLGLKLESKPVNFSFPVVFDGKGVPIPQPIAPPPAPRQDTVALPPLPTILPFLLEAEGPPGPGGGRQKIPLTLATGEPIRIPSVVVIPGNVGYLKQFFSAQLFVANGAPVGSGLVVRDVTGTIELPLGEDGEPDPPDQWVDDPLALPKVLRDGQEIVQPATLSVRGLGPDGQPGTADDTDRFAPGQPGQAEFLLRGELEGFHQIDFDIAATLDGLPVGPVAVSGKASGGVLVRNASFDMSFTVPAVVRRGEKFKLYATVTNIGQGLGNDIKVTIDSAALSGAHLDCDPLPPEQCDPTIQIPFLKPRDAKTIAFTFESEKTGQVVASYLHFAPGPNSTADAPTGSLNFTLGVGERGVPLSPDTLVLPSSVDRVPTAVVDAAMRVLGQAWSIANAPAGSLPKGVIRISKAVATKKALALAEAGLRLSLRPDEAQAVDEAVRDLVFDQFGGSPLDPGFDQLLRDTDAGRDLVLALGAELAEATVAAGGGVAYERELAQLAASGPDFISFAVSGDVGFLFRDGAVRSAEAAWAPESPRPQIPGAVVLPLGPPGPAPVLGVVTAPVASPYVLDLIGRQAGSVELSVSLPRGDGTVVRASATLDTVPGGTARVVLDLARPTELFLEEDPNGDGTFDVRRALATEVLSPEGPTLLAAAVIGPDLLAGAGPFGFNVALLFDRVVDPTSAADEARYRIPDNAVRSAKAQLSGRLVFATLEQPEGRYVPTTLAVGGIADMRGGMGGDAEVALQSFLTDPGAVVSGRVFTAEGEAVGGSVVTYSNNLDLLCEQPVVAGLAAVKTDGDGRYAFRYVRQDKCGVPFGITTVDPATGGTRSASASIRTPGERINLDFALFGRGSVEGTVVDLEDAPVPGAKVVAVSQTDPQIGGATTADGNGYFLIPGITVGPVTVKAASPTASGSATTTIVRAGTTASVVVHLNSGAARVPGRVRKLEAGEFSDVPGLHVLYQAPLPGYQGRPVVGVTQTDGSGRFVFEGMPLGDFTISAALNTRDRDQKNGSAHAGDNAEVVLTIIVPDAAELATVKGRVRLPGDEEARRAVVMVGGRGAAADDHGEFVIPGVTVSPNFQTLIAHSADGRRSATKPFVASQPGEIDVGTLVLSGLGQAEFTVVDHQGQPVPDIHVALLTHCDDPCGCRPTKTNAEGKALFSDLPVGSVVGQVIKLGSGFADAARATASIAHDDDIGRVTLRLEGVGTVFGTVYDPDGRPAFGADIALRSRVFRNDGQFVCGLVEEISHRVRTGTDGKFHFPNVNVGPVSVTASQAFFPTQVGDRDHLSGHGKSVEFTLRLVSTISGELSGTVYLPNADPKVKVPAGAGVEVTATGLLPDVTVKTNAQGRFRFAKIFPEGNYRLEARDPVTGFVAQDWVYLRAREDLVHDLRLKGRGTVRVRVVDGADQPVTDAFVRLTETEFPNRTYEGAAEIANQGLVVFENVFEGPVSVDVRDIFARGGRASAYLPSPGATIDVKVRLTTTGRVEGHFYKRDRTTPIPFGTVRLIGASGALGQTTTLGFGDVGFFSFEHVPAGAVRLEAQDPLTARTAVAEGRIETADQKLTLNLIAQGLGTVQGLVTRNNTPEKGARVEVVSGFYRATTLTDPNGHYVVNGVPEGTVAVTASVGSQSLAGTNSGRLLGDGAVLDLDVALRGSGALSGHVKRPDGIQAGPPSRVTLQAGGLGGGQQTTISDEDGAFSFGEVPAGPVTLRADVLDGNDFATGAAEVPSGGIVEDVILKLQGAGEVVVEVRDAGGNLVAEAPVTVESHGYSASGITGSNGEVVLRDILAGLVKATAYHPSLGLQGRNEGLLADQGTVRIVVKLDPVGRVAGKVFRSDGTIEAVGVEVRLLGPVQRTTSTEAGKGFAFEDVPIGSYELRASDEATGDRGEAKVVVTGAGTFFKDVRLTGVGQVRVRVGDPPVADAEVWVTSSGGTSFYGKTPESGELVLERVLAGDLDVRARLLSLGRGGSAKAKLLPGGDVLVVVPFDPVGRLYGRISEPDGKTPVKDAEVSISGRKVLSGDDGAYEVPDVPLSPAVQRVEVRKEGRLRAKADNVVVSAGDPDVRRDFTLVGLATVQGFVKGPDGQPALGVEVSIYSYTGLAGALTDRTDGVGRYEIENVPVGKITVSAADSQNHRASRTLQLSSDGQVLLADLDLAESAVSVPLTLVDANGFRWDIPGDGAIHSDTCRFYNFPYFRERGDRFSGDCVRRGAPRLSIVQEDIETVFAGDGSTVAPSEEDGRELVLRQDGLAGLNVTRKAFVPTDGYFARFLDTIENPGPGPVLVDIVEEVNLSGENPTPPNRQLVVASSAEPVAATPEDRWLVIDDANGGDWYQSTFSHLPPVAVVFSGAGGVAPAEVLTTNGANSSSRVTYRWRVEIAEGEAVSLLQFFSLQGDRERAAASGERLAGLPPEALAGLSAEEAGRVLNFDVREDLTSSLEPLPPNDGSVGVRVLAGDGETPLPPQKLTYRSRSPYYGKPLDIDNYHPQEGRHWLRSRPTVHGPSGWLQGTYVPRTEYDVTATWIEPFTNEQRSASSSGTFPASGTVDLTTAIGRTLSYSSRQRSFLPPPENAVDGDLDTFWQWDNGDAAGPPYFREPFFEIGFPAPVTVRQIRLRGGRGFWASASFHRVRFEIRDESRGLLWSAETDLPPPSRDIDFDVPAVAGARSVRVVDVLDDVNAPGFSELQVLGDGLTTPTGRSETDVRFDGTAVVEGHVRRADGTPIRSSLVDLEQGTRTLGVSTPEDGLYRFIFVPAGGQELLAHLSYGAYSIVEGPVSLAVQPNQRVVQNFQFAPLGALAVQLYRADGETPAYPEPFNGGVILTRDGITLWGQTSPYAYTGLWTFADVPPGDYSLQVKGPLGYSRTRPVTIVAGATTRQEFVFPPMGRARVTVSSDGQRVAGSRVDWQADERGPEWVTHPSRTFLSDLFIEVMGPTFRIRAFQPNSELPALSVTSPPQSLLVDNQEVPVTIDLPPAASVAGMVGGVVRRADGTPFAQIPIQVVAEDGTVAGEALTDASGGYTYGVAPIGSIRVNLRSDGGSPVEAAGVIAGPGASIALDLDAAGAILAAGERDLWRASLSAGETVTVSLYNRQVGALPPLGHPVVEVLDPTGALVATGQLETTPYWKRSLVEFVPGADGVYTFVARAAAGETGAYGLLVKSSFRTLSISAPPGMLTGSVTRRGSGAAVVGQRLWITGSLGFAQQALTDNGGAFTVRGVPEGDFVIEALDAENVVLASASGTVPPGGGTLERNLVVSSHGTITVTVRRGLLTLRDIAVTFQSVTDDDASVPESDRIRVRPTGIDGRVTTSLPVGTVTARAVDPLSGTGATYATAPTVLSEGASLNLEILFPETNSTIRGTVFGGDGQTPVAGATVEILSPSRTTTSDATGVYRFPDLLPGTYTVRATFETRSVTSPPVTVSGGETTVNLTIPAPVLRGLVTEPPAARPVGGATVSVCGPEVLNGPHTLCRSATSAPDGNYAIVLPPWRFVSSLYVSVVATFSDDSGISTWNFFFLQAAMTGEIRVNLAFPTTGTVTGTVWDGLERVAEAPVTLTPTFGTPRSATADGNGVFRFPHVLANQSVRLYAEHPEHRVPGAATGPVNTGENVIDVHLAPTVTLDGVLKDGAVGLSAEVSVAALEAPRTSDFGPPWARVVTSAADGTFSLRVPVGVFRAVYAGEPSGSCQPVRPAADEGVLVEGVPGSATLERGNVVYLSPELTGPLGAYTPVGGPCGGDPGGSLTTQARSVDPYALARPEAAGRAYRTLLSTGRGLRVRRQHFVPPSGAFVRVLTTIDNPTTNDITISLISHIAWQTTGWGIEATGSGDTSFSANDSYVVVRRQRERRIGVVLGGLLASNYFYFFPGGAAEGGGINPGNLHAEHALTIPAGQTRAFLTFTVARPADDQSVLAQTRALADLSDPEALSGLSQAEIDSTVNFPPPAAPTGVTGVARDLGGQGIPEARIGVFAAGVLVAQGLADGSGEFTLAGLPPGEVTVITVDPRSNRPGRKTAIVPATGLADLGDVLSIPDAEAGTVTITGTASDGGSVEGLQVEVLSEDYGSYWKATVTLDAQGLGTAFPFPAGRVFVRWSVANVVHESDHLDLAPGASLDFPLILPATLLLPIDLRGADGLPYVVQTDGTVQQSTDGEGWPFAAARASIEGWSLSASDAGLRLGGREVAFAPLTAPTVELTRRVFVPAGGHFARVLDVIRNPGPDDAFVSYDLATNLNASGAWTLAVSSNANPDPVFDAGTDYAVFANESSPTLGVVLGGPGAEQRAPSADWSGEGSWSGSALTSWPALNVPGNQTVIVMHFFVQRAGGPAGVAQVEDQLKKLRDLTEPRALDGLTEEEKGAIVNFKVIQ